MCSAAAEQQSSLSERVSGWNCLSWRNSLNGCCYFFLLHLLVFHSPSSNPLANNPSWLSTSVPSPRGVTFGLCLLSPLLLLFPQTFPSVRAAPGVWRSVNSTHRAENSWEEVAGAWLVHSPLSPTSPYCSPLLLVFSFSIFWTQLFSHHNEKAAPGCDATGERIKSIRVYEFEG